LAALTLALEQQTFGAEYVQALLTAPRTQPRRLALTEHSRTPLLALPQGAVERELALYEQYVANREQVLAAMGGVR
jgi:hypothetical protein